MLSQIFPNDVLMVMYHATSRNTTITPPKTASKYTKPIGSMLGIFTYIYHKNQPNEGKYTIHGSYGYQIIVFQQISCAKTGSSPKTTMSFTVSPQPVHRRQPETPPVTDFPTPWGFATLNVSNL